MQGIIRAVCISEEKGTEKHPVPTAHLRAQHGIEGDAHAGPWHRQVSLLSYEKVEEFNRRGAEAVGSPRSCVSDTAPPDAAIGFSRIRGRFVCRTVFARRQGAF